MTGILNDGPKVLPRNVCILGARSYEEDERELLERLGVRIIYMDEVKQAGLDAAFKEAFDIVNRGTIGYGLSFDLDSVDPQDPPARITPGLNGLRWPDLHPYLSQCLRDDRLLAAEIPEFNPSNDIDGKTLQVIEALLFEGTFAPEACAS